MTGISHKNLPEWIERNVIFRKLFLLRKLYLTKRKFIHYSGAAEDVSIRKIFSNKASGLFIDVGCYHPIKYSNTWALYKKGWRGINIDIDAIKIELFNMVRRDDVNITCAVSNKSGTTKYYRAGLFSQINSIDKNSADELEQYITMDVECKTLTELIDGTKYKNKQIDFLSVDAEGHDFEVLTSLDFTRYNPLLIAVEIHEPIFDRVEKSELYKYLRNLNYSLAGWCGESLLMANSELQRTLVKARN